MQKSLYDIKEIICKYLIDNGITIKADTDESDFPFVSIDLSMNLNNTPVSESGRSFNLEVEENKIISVTMPFILTAFIYGGNNKSEEVNKRNIEELFLLTNHLLGKWRDNRNDVIISLKGNIDAVWMNNPILENKKVDSSIIKMQLGGWAIYG